MADRVLVAYATKYGATAEIAEKITEVLRSSGLTVEVRPVASVSDLSAYEVIVLGSAVYIGKWRKDAVKFLKANEKALAQRKVWLFSSGPTEKGDPVELLEGWRYPKALEPVINVIKPRDVAVFHGYNNPEKMSGPDKWMINRVKAPLGDFRDWDAIAAWAGGIASQIEHEAGATPGGHD